MSCGVQLVETVEKIVTCNDCDAELFTCAASWRKRANCGGARTRIDPAGVGDDAYSLICNRRKNAFDRSDEVARVAHLRIALLLLLQDRHRHLRQVIEHQIIDLPALYLLPWCFQRITPESLTSRYPYSVLHVCSPR